MIQKWSMKITYKRSLAIVKVGTTVDAPDLALLVDGLQAEREQGITIDVAYRYFSTEKRKFIIADTPGHNLIYAQYGDWCLLPVI